MLTNRTLYARLCALFLISLFSSSVFAAAVKVEVCHIPPGDPDNFHTIKISEKALDSHLAHLDLLGACPDEPPECDGESGTCPEVPCPCFDESELIAFDIALCEGDTDIDNGFNVSGGLVCSGFGCTDKGTAEGLPGCSYQASSSDPFIDHAISNEVNDTCRSLLKTYCP